MQYKQLIILVYSTFVIVISSQSDFNTNSYSNSCSRFHNSLNFPNKKNCKIFIPQVRHWCVSNKENQYPFHCCELVQQSTEKLECQCWQGLEAWIRSHLENLLNKCANQFPEIFQNINYQNYNLNQSPSEKSIPAKFQEENVDEQNQNLDLNVYIQPVNNVGNYNENQQIYQFQYNSDLNQQNDQFQQNSDQNSKIQLFIGVLSASKNFDRRQAVRQTWGKDQNLQRVLFFIGRPSNLSVIYQIREEAEKYNDIVLLPYVQESYENVTYQTLEIFRWGAMEIGATHVMKTDDDTYIRVQKLIERLNESAKNWMFMGNLELEERGGRVANRDTNSQWYISWEEWPNKFYPRWAHGAGYIVTKDLAQEIASGAALLPSGPKLFRLEDVAMGMWIDQVAKDKKISINYVNDNNFGYWTECFARYVIIHYVKPQKMLKMFKAEGACVH